MERRRKKTWPSPFLLFGGRGRMENEETNTTAPWPTVQYVVRVYELYVGPKLIDCALATVRRDAHVNVLRPRSRRKLRTLFPNRKKYVCSWLYLEGIGDIGQEKSLVSKLNDISGFEHDFPLSHWTTYALSAFMPLVSEQISRKTAQHFFSRPRSGSSCFVKLNS